MSVTAIERQHYVEYKIVPTIEPCIIEQMDETYFDFNRTEQLTETSTLGEVIAKLEQCGVPEEVNIFVVSQLIKLGKIHPTTLAHSIDTANIMWHFTKGIEGISAEEKLQFYVAALLHDIGKQDPAILELLDKYRLTDDEKKIVSKHPAEGINILDDSVSYKNNLSWWLIIRDAIHYHHIDWSGKGYPEIEEMKEENIPKVAQILRLCDSLSAATLNRGYNQERELASLLKSFAMTFGGIGIINTAFNPDLFLHFQNFASQHLKVSVNLN